MTSPGRQLTPEAGVSGGSLRARSDSLILEPCEAVSLLFLEAFKKAHFLFRVTPWPKKVVGWKR